jgi:hypothetical protein
VRCYRGSKTEFLEILMDKQRRHKTPCTIVVAE